MSNETRTAKVLVRVRPTFKVAIEKAAKAENRTLSGLIETLLTEHLRAKGTLPK